MVVISAKEFRNRQKKYFDLAKDEKVFIKRGESYVNLIVTENLEDNYFSESWVKEFLAIPDKYRCNPFNTSPSGDLFWADRRNVEHLHESITRAKQQFKDGQYTECKTYEDSVKHLESL